MTLSAELARDSLPAGHYLGQVLPTKVKKKSEHKYVDSLTHCHSLSCPGEMVDLSLGE